MWNGNGKKVVLIFYFLFFDGYINSINIYFSPNPYYRKKQNKDVEVNAKWCLLGLRKARAVSEDSVHLKGGAII